MRRHLKVTNAIVLLAILFVATVPRLASSFFSTSAATQSPTPLSETVATNSQESVSSTEATATYTPRPAPVLPTPPQVSPTPGVAAGASSSASSKRIVLQAGHWKYQQAPAPLNAMTGTSGGGKTEPEVTLAIANETAKILRDWGHYVEIVPAVIPADLTADLFVAIHADGNASSSPRGFFTDRRAEGSKVSAAEARLTAAIDAEYAKVTGIPYINRSTVDSRYYYGYRAVTSSIPAVLIETGFLTNPLDQAILIGQPQKAAEGIANGIKGYLGQ